MRQAVAVDFLSKINTMIARKNQDKFLLIMAEGYSEDGMLGVPKLILKEPAKGQREDLLEFDFVIEPAEFLKRKKLSWEVEVVYDLNKLPSEPSWIKVNAGENADISKVRIMDAA